MIRPPTIRNIQFAGPILAVLALAACDLLQEPKLPTWTNKVEFPLIRTSVNLETLKDQENIRQQLYGLDDTIYAYADTTVMDSQAVGDQLVFDDIHKNFEQSVDDVSVTGSQINQASGFDPVGVDSMRTDKHSTLGPITLNPIEPTTTSPITMIEIVPGIDLLEGDTTAIDPVTLIPVIKPFTFSAFDTATFTSGILEITINNYLVIPLGSPLNIQLRQVVGVDTIDVPGGFVSWTIPIPDSSSRTEELNLSGMTLPGNILLYITGETIGSQGEEIPVNQAALNSSFNVEIGGSGMVVSSATAKIPSQTISLEGNIPLAPSENIIERAEIKTGTMAIIIDNRDMAVDSKLVLEIPTLEDPLESGFLDSLDIPASDSITYTFPISGYSLVMTEAAQQVNYNYIIRTLDSGDDKILLAETDKIDVSILLYGLNEVDSLFFNSIIGKIESQSIADSGEISISSESKIIEADISEGALTINIDNQINQPGSGGLPIISLQIEELLDQDGLPLDTTFTVESGNPVENNIEIPLSEYTLSFLDYEYPDTSAQILNYTTQVITNSGETGNYSLVDSIIVNIDVSDMKFSSATGHFSQDAMVDSSEIVLDEGTKLTEAIFDTGKLYLTMINQIGVLAHVDFQIDEIIDGDGESLSMSLDLLNTDAAQVDSIDLSDYKLVFYDVNPDFDQEIHYVSAVSLDKADEMTLSFGESISIDVNLTGFQWKVSPDLLS